MYHEAFIKLELSESGDILEKLNPEFDGTRFDPLEAVILAQNVSFYPGFRLLDIADYSTVPSLRCMALYSKNKHVILNYTNEPIYRLNNELPLSLSDKNVCDYARFFFSHVRGPRGKFTIVEAVDDIDWKDDPPPAARKAIGKMITPLTLKPQKGAPYFEIAACMMFKDSLYKNKIRVDHKGVIALSDEELMVEDMPVMDSTFGH